EQEDLDADTGTARAGKHVAQSGHVTSAGRSGDVLLVAPGPVALDLKGCSVPAGDRVQVVRVPSRHRIQGRIRIAARSRTGSRGWIGRARIPGGIRLRGHDGRVAGVPD